MNSRRDIPRYRRFTINESFVSVVPSVRLLLFWKFRARISLLPIRSGKEGPLTDEIVNPSEISPSVQSAGFELVSCGRLSNSKNPSLFRKNEKFSSDTPRLDRPFSCRRHMEPSRSIPWLFRRRHDSARNLQKRLAMSSRLTSYRRRKLPGRWIKR